MVDVSSSLPLNVLILVVVVFALLINPKSLTHSLVFAYETPASLNAQDVKPFY